jgi:hyaluronate lyase
MFSRILCLSVALLFVSFVHADEFDDLRLAWRDTIIGSGYDTQDSNVASRLNSIANQANSYWSSMDVTQTRTFLWSDAASTTISAQISTNYFRLRAMALAYATPGCPLEGNAMLLSDLLDGLDWMHTNRYNATKSIYDNWWDFEIGSPLSLNDITVLLYDQLSPAQKSNFMGTVEKFTPSATTKATGGTSGTFTGANRMWKIRVVAVRGAIVKDAAKLLAARNAFSNLFVYVTSGDGFYTDGSYVQHSVHPYTAGYGNSLLATIAPVMAWLSGSTWEVTDPAQANIYNWIFDSFEPILYRGAAFDLVRGRESGRSNANPQATGHSIMDSILLIAQFVPPAEAARMKSMVKEWALRDTVRDFVSNRPLPTLTLAKELMNDAGVSPRGELIGHFHFAEMDRVVHLGAGYGFGISMCSTRIANFESINGDNLRGWFTGDGHTALYTSDLGQYGDAYWATIDPYRLPGVTADVTHNKLPAVAHSIGPRAQGQSTTSPHNWVGGATLGRFGTAGMQFKGVGVTLTGKKSWFLFDDEIVCLGAGITSTDNRPIETIVDNRKIAADGANAFTVNGAAKPNTPGWSESLSSVNWAHLAGPVTGSDIGYFFPQAATLAAVREARTGAWSDVDDNGSSTPITRNYLRMSFEHGSSPVNAAYQYVILPGRNVRRMGHYAEAPQINVIVNSANMQAVEETTLGITAANFWTDTTQTAGILTANKKCSVLVQNDGTFIDVSVSDPTQVNTGSIAIQIALDGGTLVSADAGVTVTQVSPSIDVSVNVSGAAGRTFKARFYLDTPETVSVPPVADAYVYDAAASVDLNFGTGSTLIVKKSGAGFNRETFLRFDVPPSSSPILGAALQLTCLSASTPGVHGLIQVPNTTWAETGITWNNQPASSGSTLSTWTPALNETASHDVTPAITGGGLVSFKLQATTQTGDGYVTYASRENGTTANRPQLLLRLGHTPPDVAISSPADGELLSKSGLVTITADAVATDGAITSVAFYDGANLLGTDTTAPYSIDATLGGGPHSLTAVATDSNDLSKTSLVSRIDVPFAPVANPGSLATQPGVAIDIDLRTLVSDVETPLASLRFEPGAATHGSVVLLPDAHTARFTPAANYIGPATFAFTVVDSTRDSRTLFHYDFQNSTPADTSGQGRDATLNIQGTGSFAYTTDFPAALGPFHSRSLSLTENGTAGAVRVDRSLTSDVIDFKSADWTIAGWFKRGAALNQDSIVHLGDSGGYASNAMTLVFYSTSQTINLRNYDGTTLDCDISTTAATGQWHHFAIVRDGGTLSWYLNGDLVGSDSSFVFRFDSSKPVKFGGVTTSVPDRWLNGSLADLALFNDVLSPAEIAKLTTTPVASFSGQTASSSVAVTILSPIDSWRQQHFGSTANTGLFADTVDKDDDGASNLLEYATAMNPNAPDPIPVFASRVGANLEFTYTRSNSATDVTYLVEWSDTLEAASWSTTGVTQSLIPDSDNGTTQQWKAVLPNGTTKRFVRLKVTGP